MGRSDKGMGWVGVIRDGVGRSDKGMGWGRSDKGWGG